MQNSATPSLSVDWMRSFLEKHAGDSPILLAVSGGLDSMVLWDLVHTSKHEYVVAHVNYHLRGEMSDADAQLVTKIAEQRNVELHVHNDHSLSKNSTGLQAHARDVRYLFFQKLGSKDQLICTAHHADDQVETILLQLGRGGGPTALAGISAAGAGRLRPLLHFSKAELSAYAKTNGIAFREDLSNATDHYLRNRIRHHLAPMAEEMFDSFRQNLGKAAEQQQQLLAFAAAMVKQKVAELKSEQWPHTLDRKKLTQVEGNSYFVHELLRRHDFSSVAISSIVNAIKDEVLQKRLFLNRQENVCLVLTGQTLHLEQTAPFEAFSIPLNSVGKYRSPLGQLSIEECNDEGNLSNSEIWVESLTNLVWRTSKFPDTISISSTQTKSIKKVLAEAKRPPLVLCAASTITSNNEVVWIVNLRKSTSLKTSKAKTVGYRLRFTMPSSRLGIIEL